MRVNCLITRFVIAGESSASPAATVRTAAISCSGGSSLRTNPLAPALSASYTYSSSPNVVRMRIRALGSAAMTRRVASRPSSSGIRISINTTSARAWRASRTACLPVAASATTARSGALCTIIRSPARTSSWSWGSSTRTAVMAPCWPGGTTVLASGGTPSPRTPLADPPARARPGQVASEQAARPEPGSRLRRGDPRTASRPAPRPAPACR